MNYKSGTAMAIENEQFTINKKKRRAADKVHIDRFVYALWRIELADERDISNRYKVMRQWAEASGIAMKSEG